MSGYTYDNKIDNEHILGTQHTSLTSCKSEVHLSGGGGAENKCCVMASNLYDSAGFQLSWLHRPP